MTPDQRIGTLRHDLQLGSYKISDHESSGESHALQQSHETRRGALQRRGASRDDDGEEAAVAEEHASEDILQERELDRLVQVVQARLVQVFGGVCWTQSAGGCHPVCSLMVVVVSWNGTEREPRCSV